MRLEDYWGVGPKTSEVLSSELGAEAAVEAIEAGDLRTLVDAGLARGRATRILRHAHADAAMDLLATRDARDVYNRLLGLLTDYAVCESAADRLRVLTPLGDLEARRARLDRVAAARGAWLDLDDDVRDALLETFDALDDPGGELGAVASARAIADLDPPGQVFEPVRSLDGEGLRSARSALAGLSGSGESLGEGADDRLDELRDALGAVEDLAAHPVGVLEAVQEGARGTDELQDELARHVAGESGVDVGRVRESMPTEAADAEAFVATTLRDLADDLRSAANEREAAVAEDLETDLEAASDTVAAAVSAVDDLALVLSLARFADAFGCEAPTIVEERHVLGVVNARNLFLEAAGETVQPITYAIGDHDLAVPGADRPPSGDRVAVLTGANSGGKTTVLETCCLVQLLAAMGLPVPAESAEVSSVDSIVFHRRHASFNAGVLESTLRSIVPPLSGPGRTLMLVDEFEAITEPGSAADLLHGLVGLSVDQPALGVYVTHLAEDLEPLPETARTDGIFAEGLTAELDLDVDYQPRFDTVGRSTPEFIVSRLVAEAGDGHERAGYRTLAEAVGEGAIQRTLADARWRE